MTNAKRLLCPTLTGGRPAGGLAKALALALIVSLAALALIPALAAPLSSSAPSSTALTQQDAPQQEYWGSIKSNKFHYPHCQWAKKIKPENLIIFKSREEALKAGYIPCKVCKP